MYRELIADHKNTIWLAADSKPIVSFHVCNYCLSETAPCIGKRFVAHAPENRIPVESYGRLLVKFVVIE